MSSPPPASANSNPPGSRSTGSVYRRFGVARHAAKVEPDEYDDDADPPAPAEIRRSATVLRMVLLTLALAGVGMVAALGGFERSPQAIDGVPVAEPNQLISAGVWDITVESATAGQEMRGTEPKEAGNYLIEVDVTVTNRWAETQSIFELIVPGLPDQEVAGLVAKDPRQHLMVRDNRLAAYVQPDLTERIAFIWEIKAGTPVPASFPLTVRGMYPRKTSFAIVNQLVRAELPAATVTVPIINRTVRA